jgi:hypothetical protein
VFTAVGGRTGSKWPTEPKRLRLAEFRPDGTFLRATAPSHACAGGGLVARTAAPAGPIGPILLFPGMLP